MSATEERKIIQITEVQGRTHALCNDGTILWGNNGRWEILDLGPVPQPESEDLIAAITDENLNRDEL